LFFIGRGWREGKFYGIIYSLAMEEGVFDIGWKGVLYKERGSLL